MVITEVQPHAHTHGDHTHAHAHHHAHPLSSRRALTWALALTGTFLWVEFAVGLWSHSLALIADAAHMLGDAGALALSLWLAHMAERPRTTRRTYGYRRAEVLGAVVNASTLALIAVWIGVHAVQRLMAPSVPIHAHGLIATAVVGLLVNIGAAWILHRHGGGGIGVRAALLHVLGDLLGSVLAIGAGLSVLSGISIADPLASLAIALLLLWGSLRLMREATGVLMEGAPAHLNVTELEQAILQTPGVRSVHDLHVWSLTSDEPMLTAHVVIAPSFHGTDVARLVGDQLRERFQLHHVTIQPEPAGPALVKLRVRER